MGVLEQAAVMDPDVRQIRLEARHYWVQAGRADDPPPAGRRGA